jgi:glycosyltransferase involved in cell wall biosynthesis
MLSRKIFIPFADSKTIGGPTTFMANLKNYLDSVNFPYAKKPWLAKGIFFPVLYRLSVIRLVKLFGGKVIQRLDGVYYPSQHGAGFEIMNKDIEKIYKHYADFVIFQSEYSKKQCFAMMGEKKETEFTIIHNGTDKKIFFSSDSAGSIGGKVRFVMTGSFRKKAMIEPVVLALDALKEKFDFELVIIGPIIEEKIERFFQRDYIRLMGPQEASSVAKTLREAHIFIHSQLNDNCPNAVLEAISCGLPVVGFDGGAMSELLFFQKDLLAYVSENIFQVYADFDYRKLQAKIEQAVTDLPTCKKIAMENANLYDFEECGKRYVEIYRKFLI